MSAESENNIADRRPVGSNVRQHMRPIMPFALICLAWCCYFLSLFCPAISIRSVASPDGGYAAEQYTGFECLVQCLILGIIPFFWLSLLPFYAAVNFCMYLSPLYWALSYDQTRRRFTWGLALCFLMTLTVPMMAEQLFSGFLLWSGSFLLAASGFALSLPHWSNTIVRPDMSLNRSGDRVGK